MKQYEPDVLIDALHREKNDSIKTRLCYLLTQYYGVLNDSLQARKYLKASEKFNEKYPFLKAIYPFYEAYIVWDDLPRSEMLFLQAYNGLKRYSMPESFFLQAKAMRNYAIHQQEKDDNKGFIEGILKAIPISKQSGDSVLTGILYQDVATVLTNQDQFEKAHEYYTQAIQYFNNPSTPVNDLAYIYILAADNITISGSVPQYPVAKDYLDKAFQLIRTRPPSINILDYYLAEGRYYYVMKLYPQSIRSFDKGIAFSKKVTHLEVHQMQNKLLYQKYFSYFDMKDYRNALAVLQKYMASEPNLSSRNRIRLYGDLSNIYVALGNKVKAYDWLEKYAVLSDSIHKVKLKEDLAVMALKFNASEKEKQIVSLQLEKNQVLLQSEGQRTAVVILSFTISLLVIGLVFGYILYLSRRRADHQKEKIKIAEAMVIAQDEERSRIARDLHDGLGSLLSGVKINLASVSDEQTDPDTKASLGEIVSQLGSSMQELRQISHNMMPEMLLRLGLETSLHDLCRLLQHRGFAIQLHCANIQPAIPAQKQVTIYRIVQELLNNIIKHAHAKNVFLQCVQQDEILLITIEDDGKGLVQSELQNTSGTGFKNIEIRVAYLNGSMDIISLPENTGTSINIQLNVKN